MEEGAGLLGDSGRDKGQRSDEGWKVSWGDISSPSSPGEKKKRREEPSAWHIVDAQYKPLDETNKCMIPRTKISLGC